MTDWSIRRVRELERRERVDQVTRLAAREQQQIDQPKNAWAQVGAARAHDMLAAYQRATFNEKAERLFALGRLINGD